MEVNIERIGSYTIEEIRTLYLQQRFGAQPVISDGDELTEHLLIEAIVEKSIQEKAPVAKTVADFLGQDRMKGLVEANAANREASLLRAKGLRG